MNLFELFAGGERPDPSDIWWAVEAEAWWAQHRVSGWPDRIRRIETCLEVLKARMRAFAF